MRAGAVRALLVALTVLGASGCVSMPDSGPISSAEAGGAADAADEPAAIDPEPPVPGASASEIVDGFLDAMQASPISPSTARLFLSSAARSSWNPELSTVTYSGRLQAEGSSRVSVALSGADLLDARGAWRGRLPSYQSVLQFTMVIEDGEYRIADPPDALVVPEVWFEDRFRPVSLYFFDPQGSRLVPEPVFAPTDQTLASTLVEGLLDGPTAPPGPGRPEGEVTRTFLPPGLEPPLSVPVSGDGVATVALSGEVAPLTDRQTTLMVAQLAWTMRQDPEIRSVEVTIDGVPLRLPGGQEQFSVDDGAPYDPTGFQASSLLYGLRNGRLVSGTPGELDPVDGVLGQQARSLRSIGVDLTATNVAGVSRDGTTLRLAAVRGVDEPVRTVIDGASDLLEPAWDGNDRLWVVDRTEEGAVVRHVVGRRVRELDVPGISGEDVTSFLISRDGSRFVAVIHGVRRDLIRVSRLEYDESGRLRAATESESIALDDDPLGRVRDIAWFSPITVAVLTRLSPGASKVSTIGVDGAPTSQDPLPTTLGDATALIGSPAPGEPLYAVTDAGLAVLSSVGGPRVLEDGLTVLDYVG